MTFSELLQECAERCVCLRADCGRLRYVGLRDIITVEILEGLTQWREELLDLFGEKHGDDYGFAEIRERFEERAAIMEHEAGLAREVAEALARRTLAISGENRGES